MPERGSIQVTLIGTTDVGRVREHNEDSLLVADLTAGDRAASGEALSRDLGGKGVVLAVADGMGGAASGELASEMAVETVFERLRQLSLLEGQTTASDMTAGLSRCLVAANEEIYQKSIDESEHRGMGTTMTAALVIGDELAIGQVGDSRAYLMRKGKLVQVTKDQSLISQLIEDGTLTPEEAEKIGGQNIILQALGVEANVTVDTKVLEVLAGDVLVLCSDGLSGMVKDEQIEKTLAESEDLGAACSRLVALANDGGGRDNITVILAEFHGSGLRSPLKPLDAREADRAAAGRDPSTFAPTTVPADRSSGRRTMLLGAAGVLLLVLLLFFLFAGGSSDVTFVFPAPGAVGKLTPAAEDGGGTGEPPIPLEPAANETSVKREVPPGRYVLTASLEPEFEPLRQVLEIRGGGHTVEVPLRRRPVTLQLVPRTPHVRVQVALADPPEGEAPWERQVQCHSLAKAVIDRVPARDLLLTQSRPGFESSTQNVAMPESFDENRTLEVTLDELSERVVPVTLDLDPGLEGAELVVRDEHDEVLWRMDRVAGGGAVDATIREGDHTLEILGHPRFQDEKRGIAVARGETVDVGPLTRERDGTLKVSGPPDAFVHIYGGEDFSEYEGAERIPEDGLLTLSLSPGDYELRLQRVTGDVSKKEKMTVAIRPAAEERVEFAP